MKLSLLSSALLLSPALASAAQPAARPDEVGLRKAWTRALGSAYSGVAVGADRVVTQFGDGEQDHVVALDVRDGALRWQHTLGPTYRGHDGSLDGPISTPAVGAGCAFVVGPRGRLVALELATGEVRWSTHLVDDLGAAAPEYGFTTTPVLEGDVLVVQAGGSESRNLCGFDAATGALRWSLGEGAAAYQSPAVLELAGSRQLVVLNGRELQGVLPETGALLWTYAFEGRDAASSGQAGAIDGARFHLWLSGRLAVFEVAASAAGFAVRELYRSRELGDTYAQPVHHAGYLYGFKSDFLTCVDAATGRRVWKSRPPGGSGLVLAGDRLVVFGAEGVVAVVRATPDGYEEVSRVQALEHSSLTWPALAAGRVLVRNSEELACLEFVERGVPSEALVAGAGEHAFGAFLRGLADADDRVQRIDAFLAAQASFPIVEDGWVHFVFRGDVEDVAVIGSMTSDSRAEPLLRVAGTHLHHRSYPIEPGARWTYAFEVDFNEPIVDPLNPRTSPGPWAPLSDVVAPGHRAVTHLAEPEGPRGRLESHEYASEQLGNSRRIQVYLPPGYDDSDARYPLLLVHDGPDWLEHGLLLNALDNLVGTRVRPLVVVFVSPLRQWWFESGGSRTEPYLAMLATELVPYLEARYRLTQDPAERGLWGVRGFGLTAVFGAVAHPDVFGLAAAQSASLGDVARHAFFAQLAASPPGAARFYVDWGRYEAHDPDSGYDFAVDGRRLFDALSRAGCTVTGGEALDCHGWGSWRSRTDVLLEALFPLR